MKRAIPILAFVGLLPTLLLVACNTERHPATLPDVHPAYWLDTDSPDFHGKVALANGTEGCRVCHGEKLDGGKVDVSCVDCHHQSGVCITCHGGIDNDSGAPPTDLHGDTATTSIGVGAHTAHLSGSNLAAAISCGSCHVVPAFLLDSTHLDLGRGKLDSIAEVNFSAPVDPDSARWNRSTATCSAVYCHGQFSGGNTDNSPMWTGSNQAECGSCHTVDANDPGPLKWKHSLHVKTIGLECTDCHYSVVDSNLAIVNPSLHVNGVVDTLIRDRSLCDNCHAGGGAGCTFCHGGKDNQTGAPPYSLNHDSLTTVRAVGAHTVHMEGSRLSDGILCNDCHIVPDDIASPGHYDSIYAAEITFGQLAGPFATYDSATATCDKTYCHGNFGGGYNTTPLWTGDSSQALCGACHDVGANPGDINFKHALHVLDFGLTCWVCHNETVDTSNEIKDKSLHINGVIDIDIGAQHVCDGCHQPSTAICDQCHGGQNGLSGVNLGAPPRGLEGETSTTSLAVGAHTVHLTGNYASNGFDCSECHTVPPFVAYPGHYGVDSVAELNFGPLAGGTAQYNFTTGQCTNVYCHGQFTNGYGFDPTWNASGQAVCGSCHATTAANAADLSGRHRKHVVSENKQCIDCHASVVSSGTDPAIIGKDLHVDGQVEVVFNNGSGTYDPSTGQCSNNGSGCHNSTHTW